MLRRRHQSWGGRSRTGPRSRLRHERRYTHHAKHRHTHDGHAYYFCSGGCQEKFIAEPAEVSRTRESQGSRHVPEGTIYTCPMHPEIRQVGPGSCPICGMALEPVLATAEAGPNAELADMTRRFWIGLSLSLPVVALEMGGHLTGLQPLSEPSRPRTGFR